MKCGKVDLKLVVVLAIKLHLLEPVAPQDLRRKVGGPEDIYFQASIDVNDTY